ncbi:MAG: hypothetical protein LCH39_01695 [Proteobacteria bacterium]|nr:hypothetical protein [Pseudomonadota bacterium]
MATDDRTSTQNFPRPHIANTIAEDFARIITLVNMLDAKISAMDGQVAGKAEAAHTHAISGIAGLQAALDAKQAASWRPALGDLSNVNVAGAASGQFLGLVGATWQPVTLSVAWGNISGKPSSFPTTWGDVSGKPGTFTPAAHSHSIGEVGGLQTALDANAAAAAAKLPLTGGDITGGLNIRGGWAQLRLGNVGGAWRLIKDGAAGVSGTLFIQHSTDDFATNFVNPLTLQTDGGVILSYKTRINAADGGLELHALGTGDRSSYVDFKSHGTPDGVDYSARIIREPGPDGAFDIINGGAGWLRIRPGFGQPVQVGVADQGNFLYIPRQDNVDEGGQLILQRCNQNTSIGADLAIDTCRNDIRFFENGGAFRGAFLRLSELPGGVNSALIHSANLGSWLAAGDTQDIGKYVMAYCNANGSEFGGSVSGANLFPAYHGGWQAGSINGTWRAQGRGITGGISLFQRIA